MCVLHGATRVRCAVLIGFTLLSRAHGVFAANRTQRKYKKRTIGAKCTMYVFAVICGGGVWIRGESVDVIELDTGDKAKRRAAFVRCAEEINEPLRLHMREPFAVAFFKALIQNMAKRLAPN